MTDPSRDDLSHLNNRYGHRRAVPPLHLQRFRAPRRPEERERREDPLALRRECGLHVDPQRQPAVGDNLEEERGLAEGVGQRHP